MIDPKFLITENIVARCSQFADNSVASSANKYARRNQFDVAKITKDIMIGKIGEQCAWSKLVELLPDLSEPDYAIYDKSNKSWDPDLKSPTKGIKIACKTQDIQSAIHFGRSWVFQNRAGANYDVDTGIFGAQDDRHYVCLISLNTPKKNGEIAALVKVSWLHEKGLFKPMQLKNLQSNKQAIYFDDLEQYKDQLWQL